MDQPVFTKEEEDQINRFYQSIEDSRGVKVTPCADANGDRMVIQLDAHRAIGEEQPYYVGLP